MVRCSYDNDPTFPHRPLPLVPLLRRPKGPNLMMIRFCFRIAAISFSIAALAASPAATLLEQILRRMP